MTEPKFLQQANERRQKKLKKAQEADEENIVELDGSVIVGGGWKADEEKRLKEKKNRMLIGYAYALIIADDGLVVAKFNLRGLVTKRVSDLEVSFLEAGIRIGDNVIVLLVDRDMIDMGTVSKEPNGLLSVLKMKDGGVVKGTLCGGRHRAAALRKVQKTMDKEIAKAEAKLKKLMRKDGASASAEATALEKLVDTKKKERSKVGLWKVELVDASEWLQIWLDCELNIRLMNFDML